MTTQSTTLAAVAAAAGAPSNDDITAAAQTLAVAAAAPTPPAAPAAETPAPAVAASAAPALSAAAALELAALALPAVRDQLNTLSAAAGETGASETSYRRACLKVAAGSTAQTASLSTSAPTPEIKKPDATPKADAIPSAASIYADRAKAMAE